MSHVYGHCSSRGPLAMSFNPTVKTVRYEEDVYLSSAPITSYKVTVPSIAKACTGLGGTKESMEGSSCLHSITV